MSATYVTPWVTTRDYMRFQVGDTVVGSAIFSDEEYDGVLAQWGGDGRVAAASMLETLAGLYARNAVSWSVPGLSVNRAQTYRALLDAAAALRKAAVSVPFEFESVVDHFIDSAGVDRSNYMNSSPDSGEWPYWP